MHYVAVEWLHLTPNEPTRLYYELDSERYERRKVEEYRDGTFHSASAAHGQGTPFLAWEPHPPLAEIEADPQFRAREINAQEFERVWARAIEGALQPATSLAR
ncbi:MAG: hypothetical protein M3Y28_09290 [Armatimonadota bacterium]|nr:hypothetical protein [Armatimonadota bacterium]